MGRRTPTARVLGTRRHPDGTTRCRVLVPYDHPTRAVTLTDEAGQRFEVDYVIEYRAGPGETIVRRREPDGSWSGRLTTRLEPMRSVGDPVLYARPKRLERAVAHAWSLVERDAAREGPAAPCAARGRLFD